MPSNATAGSPLLRRLNTIFADQAQDYAVIDRDHSLTYAQLDAASTAMAHTLTGLAHPVAGLYMNRSVSSVLAAVAAAKAGVAYVPMGLDWPEARCAGIAHNCRLACVLGSEDDLAGCDWAKDLPHIDPASFLKTQSCAASAPASALPASAAADTTLYIMHTSGSTGTPKGVCVHHAGIHDIFGSVAHLGYEPRQHMVHGASMTFDMSIMELWGGLLNGCTLHISDPETLLDAVALQDFLERNAIGLLLLPTSVFNVVCSQNPAVFRSLRHLCFGGELPGKTAIESALAACPRLELHNCYGPTELRIFRTVLEDREFMPQDSFLEAGGSSIMAARLIASLREYSGIAVPFSLILEPQTATRASLYIENARLGQHQEQGPHPDTSEITARI